MNHLGTKTIETERLILRPFRLSDSADMYNNWANNCQVTQFLTWPTHASQDVSEMILTEWVQEAGNLTKYQWCIEWKENHQAIGGISAVLIKEETESVEIGYCIGEAYWNKGIMTEAFREIIRFFFEEVKCNRIYAEHDVQNPNSGKVMTKAGLTYEGTLKEAGHNNTGICDMAIYGITKKMYLYNERS